MSVDARITVPARSVHCDIVVRDARTIALLGPNGAGKSTVLGAIAGTLDCPGSSIAIDGERVDHLGAPARRMALVTQREDLFPALTVLDNVAYGPRSRGLSRAHARAEARDYLDTCGLSHLSDRKPSTLSGGQARRVAIARALAAQPRALLLDEPLAGIDVEAATAVRTLIRTASRTTPTIVATHDAADAWALAAHVVTIHDGAVSDSGTTEDVLSRPLTTFAAQLAGRVLLTGQVQDAGLLVSPDTVIPTAPHTLAPGTQGHVAFSPRHVTVSPTATANGIDDVVRRIEQRGDAMRVWGELLAADVDPEQCVGLEPGSAVHFVLSRLPVPYSRDR